MAVIFRHYTTTPHCSADEASAEDKENTMMDDYDYEESLTPEQEREERYRYEDLCADMWREEAD